MRSSLLLLLSCAIACGGKRKPAETPESPPPPAVENRLDDDEPLPPPEEVPPPGGAIASTGSAECDELLRVFEDLMVRCDAQLGPAKDAMRQAIDAQRASFESYKQLPPADYAAAIDASRAGCQAGIDALGQVADAMKCPP